MKNQKLDKKQAFQLPEASELAASSTAFKVPDGYFDALESDIFLKIEAVSNLENEVGLNHFTIPENYFEGLPVQIQEKINGNSSKHYWKDWIAILLRPQVSLAFASLLVLLWFAFKLQDKKAIEIPELIITVDEFSDSEYLQDYDESTIIDLLATQQEINPSNSIPDSYIQYLLDNNIDISQIENSL